MELPQDISLPFFAYGLFRRGQLGFLRLRDFIERAEDASSKGDVLERDGLPILDPASDRSVDGSLYWLRPDGSRAAYLSICELEPDKQYSWDVRDVLCRQQMLRANVLVGRRPGHGSVHLDEPWDGRTDPLFRAGLEVVREILEKDTKFEWSLHSLFRLEMAYLLLWAAIERYASLRHRIGGGPVARIMEIAKESSFATALRQAVPPDGGNRQVFRADDPKESYRLNPDDPAESMNFYYQVRNNATHRGKAAPRDFDLVRDSLGQLLPIFEAVLSAAFEDATS